MESAFLPEILHSAQWRGKSKVSWDLETSSKACMDFHVSSMKEMLDFAMLTIHRRERQCQQDWASTSLPLLSATCHFKTCFCFVGYSKKKKKRFETVLKCVLVEIVPVMEHSMGTGLELMIRQKFPALAACYRYHLLSHLACSDAFWVSHYHRHI